MEGEGVVSALDSWRLCEGGRGGEGGGARRLVLGVPVLLSRLHLVRCRRIVECHYMSFPYRHQKHDRLCDRITNRYDHSLH